MSELKKDMDRELQKIKFSEDMKYRVMEKIELEEKETNKLKVYDGGRGKKRDNAKTMKSGKARFVQAAAVVLSVGVIAPSSVYAAQRLYQMHLDKENYKVDVVIQKNEEISDQKKIPGNSTETITADAENLVQNAKETANFTFGKAGSVDVLAYYKPEFTYLPEGLEPFPGDRDKFYDPKYTEGKEAGTHSLSPCLTILDTEDEVTTSVLYALSYKQLEVNGHSAYIVHKDEPYEMDEAGILFEEEHCLLEFYVGKSYSEDEIIKIMEGVKMVPDPEREYTTALRYSEGGRTESSEEYVLGEDLASAPEKVYHLKDKLPGNVFAPDCEFVVDNVEYFDNVADFDLTKFSNRMEQIEQDGKIKPWTRETWEYGDGINTLDKLIKSEEVNLKFVLMTVTVTNNGTEDVSEYGTNEFIGFYDEAADGTMTRNENEPFFSEPVYLDGTTKSGEDKGYYTMPIKAGETVTYKLGFFVDEDMLGNLFWTHCVDMQSNVAGSKYALVDIREK